MKRVFTIALLCAILAPCAAYAQVDRATLTGTIKDTVGALVPGATVSITNQATNAVQHQVTTDTGEYLCVSLMPGKYQIDVELSGFKKNSQIVTLEVGQRARVDAVLEVGAVTESLEGELRRCWIFVSESFGSIARTRIAFSCPSAGFKLGGVRKLAGIQSQACMRRGRAGRSRSTRARTTWARACSACRT